MVVFFQSLWQSPLQGLWFALQSGVLTCLFYRLLCYAHGRAKTVALHGLAVSAACAFLLRTLPDPNLTPLGDGLLVFSLLFNAVYFAEDGYALLRWIGPAERRAAKARDRWRRVLRDLAERGLHGLLVCEGEVPVGPFLDGEPVELVFAPSVAAHQLEKGYAIIVAKGDRIVCAAVRPREAKGEDLHAWAQVITRSCDAVVFVLEGKRLTLVQHSVARPVSDLDGIADFLVMRR